MPVEAVSITGKLKFYDLTADNGNIVSSGFCSTCGSPILKKTSGYNNMLFYACSSLDDPSLFKPEQVIWSASKQPWDFVDPDLETE